MKVIQLDIASYSAHIASNLISIPPTGITDCPAGVITADITAPLVLGEPLVV
jgi:hypothetical protein